MAPDSIGRFAVAVPARICICDALDQTTPPFDAVRAALVPPLARALPARVSVIAGIETVPDSAPVTGASVMVPLVAFWKPMEPTVEPATPITGVGVMLGTPVLLVFSREPFAVAKQLMTFDADA